MSPDWGWRVTARQTGRCTLATDSSGTAVGMTTTEGVTNPGRQVRVRESWKDLCQSLDERSELPVRRLGSFDLGANKVTIQCLAHPRWPRPSECAGCRAAAEKAQTQLKEERAAAAAVRHTAAVERSRIKAEAIAACWMCDESGYRNMRVCHHDETAFVAAKQGAARIRELLRQNKEQT